MTTNTPETGNDEARCYESLLPTTSVGNPTSRSGTLPHNEDTILFSASLGKIYSLVEQALNVEDLFQHACEHIVQQTGVTAAYIVLLETSSSGQSGILAAAGPDSTHLRPADITDENNIPGDSSIIGRVYRTRLPLIFKDIANDPRLAPLFFPHPDLQTISAVGIPIFRGAKCLGALVVTTNRINHFNDAIVSLLQRTTEVLAIGMDRAEARLLSNRCKIINSVLLDVNGVIAQNLEPHRLYHETVQKVANASSTLRAYIAEVIPEKEQVCVVACAGQGLDEELTSVIMRTPLSTHSSDPMGQSISGVTYRAQRAVVWSNITNEKQMPFKKLLAKLKPSRSMVGLPIYLHDRCTAILIIAATEPNFFSGHVVTLSKRLATHIGLALKALTGKEEFSDQSLTDHLTGLPNRMLFMDRLQMEIARSERSGSQVAVVMIELNNFTEINNKFGQPTVDNVLKEVGERLSASLRKSDTIARLDKGKFAALIPSYDNASHIDRTIERLQNIVNTSEKFKAGSLLLHTSIGIATYPDDGKRPEELLHRADVAMHRIKQQDGNSWGLFEEDLEKKILRRNKLEDRFKTALTNGDINFHYQPIVDLNEGKVVGAEALARWYESDHNLVPSGDWICVVEENPQLIALLGRRVLEVAIRQLQRWHISGEKLWISVNIGVRHLLARNFMVDLRNALSLAPELASFLIIELRETALIEYFQQVSHILNEIRSLGVQVALDDFGTGQASLTNLQKLPTDKIKLDISIVKQMLTDVQAFGIVAAAIQGAWTKGLASVAEGVETNEHVQRLKQMGCRCVQGNAISPPLPSDEFRLWQIRWKSPTSWQQSYKQVLIHSEVQLLASTIQHRARHQAIVETSKKTQILCNGMSDVRRQFPCPMPLSLSELQHAGTASKLQKVHYQLHSLENTCLARLGQSNTMPEKILNQMSMQLKEYESLVASVLDSVNA